MPGSTAKWQIMNSSGSTLLNDITVVIFTYERHCFLKRKLAFLSETGLKTLIADGSSSNYDGPLPDNVRYFHLPELNVYQRLTFLANHVDTKYVLPSADDDFVFLPTLEQGASFLEQNPDFNSVQGSCFVFQQYFSKSSVQFFEVGRYAREFSLVDEDPALRLKTHFGNYMHNFYALQRSCVWREFYKEFNPYLMPHSSYYQYKPAMGEFCHSFALVSFGKHKVLSEPWMLRENMPKFDVVTVDYEEAVENLDKDYLGILADFVVALETYRDPAFDWKSLTKERLRDFIKFGAGLVPKTPNMAFGDLETLLAEQPFSQSIILAFHDCHQLITSHSEAVYAWMIQNCDPLESLYGRGWREDMKRRFKILVETMDNYVLFGAGEHTKALHEIGALDERLVAIADNNSKIWGTNLLEKPCIQPDRLLAYSANVIISSKQHIAEIQAQLATCFGARVNVYTLY
ncbi:hypothetical protein GCM10009092_33910 [Bowmanella denitrificans]|uniref:Uncharacterized protein n=1 Tax=Bowmanella denitrificans TaxID=366582 RepID=A0ABP3HC10_9ALTE